MDVFEAKELILKKLSDEYKSEQSISSAERLVNFVHTDMGFDNEDKEPFDRSIYVILIILLSFSIMLVFVLVGWGGYKQDHPGAEESELLPWAISALLFSILIGIAAFFTRSKYCAFFDAKEQLENYKASLKNKTETKFLLNKYDFGTN
jgi:hypothetical protein